MRKIIVLILLTSAFVIMAFFSLPYKIRIAELKAVKLERLKDIEKQIIKEEIPARIGEKISYDVKLGKVRLGKAKFCYLMNTELNGVSVGLMTFETVLAKFKDLEKIYSDIETFLPLKVERGINVWSKKEDIIEEYNQKEYTLTITKLRGKRKEEVVIKKDGPIHNAILLPYHVRRIPELGLGWIFLAKLPTQEFEIKLISVEDVKVPAGTFKSYRFESTPKRFEIWISADERRIPLKIKGSGGIGYTLVMREYSI